MRLEVSPGVLTARQRITRTGGIAAVLFAPSNPVALGAGLAGTSQSTFVTTVVSTVAQLALVIAARGKIAELTDAAAGILTSPYLLAITLTSAAVMTTIQVLRGNVAGAPQTRRSVRRR